VNAFSSQPERPENAARHARLAELLAERALHAGEPGLSGDAGIASEEAAELAMLRREMGNAGSALEDEHSYVIAAGAALTAFAAGDAKAMPAALRERIASKGRQAAREMRGETVGQIAHGGGVVGLSAKGEGSQRHSADTDRSTSHSPARGRGTGGWRGVSMWTGWMTAAAAVGVAVWLSAGRETSVVGPIQSSIVKLMLNTPVELYDRLTGGGRQDVVTIAAHAAGDDGASDVEAQFLVDPATNEAVIRISGLPSTAGTETRYQVWVQDAGRSDPHPVSGGLVSIPFEGASYVLKVEPSVPIIRAVGFAITREARGGAVVSRPDRIVVRGELMDARQYGPFEPIEDMQGGDGSRGNEPGPDVLTKP